MPKTCKNKNKVNKASKVMKKKPSTKTKTTTTTSVNDNKKEQIKHLLERAIIEVNRHVPASYDANQGMKSSSGEFSTATKTNAYIINSNKTSKSATADNKTDKDNTKEDDDLVSIPVKELEIIKSLMEQASSELIAVNDAADAADGGVGGGATTVCGGSGTHANDKQVTIQALKEDRDKYMDCNNYVHNVASKKHKYYNDLVWFARSEAPLTYQPNFIRDHVNEFGPQFLYDLSQLRGNSNAEASIWHHGFNSGCLASFRLMMILSSIYEPDIDDQEEAWTQSIEQRRAFEMQQFPDLDT